MPRTREQRNALHYAIHPEGDFYDHDFRADYQYRFQPQAVADRDVSSTKGGPQLKTVQWDAANDDDENADEAPE